MKKDTTKRFWNTILYAGVCGVAVWKTWEVITLKQTMKMHAKKMKEVEGQLERTDSTLDDVRRDLRDANPKLELAQLQIAYTQGVVQFIQREMSSD